MSEAFSTDAAAAMEDRFWSYHTDYKYLLPPNDLAGVKVFSLLANLEPGGGGTVIVDGSPGLVRNVVSKVLPEKLQQQKMKHTRLALMESHPWLQAIRNPISLNQPESWMAGEWATVDDIPVRVVEITGKAGDVVFCHPWLLHSNAPNRN